MKKTVLFLMFSLSYLLVKAQFTIREIDSQEEQVYSRPVYDSLENFVEQEKIINYKKYIGLQLYFPERSRTYTTQRSAGKDAELDTLITIFRALHDYKIKRPGSKKNIETNVYQPEILRCAYKLPDCYRAGRGEDACLVVTKPSSVEGKSFTILDILWGENEENRYSFSISRCDAMYPIFQNFKEAGFISLEEASKNSYAERFGVLKFILKDDTTGDTLYYNDRHYRNFLGLWEDFVLLPYFIKKQQLYQGKYLVATKALNSNDLHPEEKVRIISGTIWKCDEIGMVSMKHWKRQQPYAMLTKVSGEKAKVKLSALSDFITEEVYNEQQRIKQLNADERDRQERERKIREEEARIQLKREYIAKYGEKIGGLIANKQVALGMTRDMCTESWGYPLRINTTIVQGVTHEQWVYNLRTYLYFDNGILTGIQH